MANTTRERIVGAGSDLFRRQGYTGTGVKQIVSQAAAPFGSLYHFFPQGKEELGEEVIRTSGALYGRLIEAYFGKPGTSGEGVVVPAPDVTTAVDNAFTDAAERLVETDFADACPIATVALEVAGTSERLRQATADVFESWIAGLTTHFESAGLDAEPAREVAVSTLALLEGAFILCRATRSTKPMEAVRTAAVARVRELLAEP